MLWRSSIKCFFSSISSGKHTHTHHDAISNWCTVLNFLKLIRNAFEIRLPSVSDCFNNGLPVVYRCFAIHCRFWEIYLWLFLPQKIYYSFWSIVRNFFYWNKSTIKLSYSGFYRASRKKKWTKRKNAHIFPRIYLFWRVFWIYWFWSMY